ncbi:hypothetical protein ACHAPT_006626 [Fusarium lateritium]
MDQVVSTIHSQMSKTAPPSTFCWNSEGLTVPLIRPPENCENRKREVFPYDPLPKPTSIRILQLRLENIENEFDIYLPLHCALTVEDLDDKPGYDALSYTWGCPVAVYSNASEVSSDAAWAAPAFDIICNGKPMSVTANLYAALLSLRLQFFTSIRQLHRNKPWARLPPAAWIWVDQICINQSDLKERSAQVMLMRRIYKQARQCPIWLGGDDGFSQAGFEAARKLVAIKSEMIPNLFRTPVFSPEKYDSIGLKPIEMAEWVALYALLSRSWFRRSWVVQEDLWDLRSRCLGSHEDMYRTEKPSQPNSCGLSYALAIFQSQRATDPRDKVYALLALAEELGQAVTLLPDYEKPVAEVFRDAMQFLLRSSNSLNDLSMKEDPADTEIPSLQSWVPDFTSCGRTPLRFELGSSPWSAGGRLGKAHIMFLCDGILEVRGLCIATARVIHDDPQLVQFGDVDTQRSFLNLVRAIPEYSGVYIPRLTPSLKLYLKDHNLIPNKVIYHQPDVEEKGTLVRQSRLEVFCRTLLADRFGREFPPSSSDTVDRLLDYWEAVMGKWMTVAGFDCLPDDRFDLTPFKNASKRWDKIKSLISSIYCVQKILSGQQIELVQDEALPEEMAAILPELDSAWAEGRATTQGQDMAQKFQKGFEGFCTLNEPLFEKWVLNNCSEKCMFATNKGQLGLGPKSTREGDEVWILAGADAPFILRRRENERYTLIGEAYVHGAMFAEAHQVVAKDIKTVSIV